MNDPADRRYRISEVSEMAGVSVYVLRQWEKHFSMLKPKRDRANRRYYLLDDIALVRRIRRYLWEERITMEGAEKRLCLEKRTGVQPKTPQEIVKLVDLIEVETRAMLNRLS